MAQLFTRLLLATEHSEYDTGAESMALALAQRSQLPLATVLPLVSNPEYESLAPQIAARAEREAAVKIVELRAQADAMGVTIDLQVRRGEEPYQEIVEEALARQSKLIIIRRRGKRSFLANLLVGEMVSKVVAHAPCHVLIVPREARMWKQRVLVAAEPTSRGLRLVTLAAGVALECGLPLHVVCVNPSDTHEQQVETFMAEALTLARQGGASAQAETRRGNPSSEILAAATECQADLIVIGNRNTNSLGRAFLGGVSQKVIGLSEKPVLLAHFAP